MVDMPTYELMHPPDSVSSPPLRLHESIMLKDEIPDAPHHPHFSLLMPPKIKGFGFHNKKWSKWHPTLLMSLTNTYV